VVHCKYRRGDRIVHVDKIQPYRSPESLENLFTAERSGSLITPIADQLPVATVVDDHSPGNLHNTQSIVCLCSIAMSLIIYLLMLCVCSLQEVAAESCPVVTLTLAVVR
jgi:hypothetical protein